MIKKGHLICAVHPEGIAREIGVEEGDRLLSIDRSPVLDVFDYRMRTSVPALLLEIEKKSGERIEFDIEKDEYEELGIEFESTLMDDCRSCRNKCVFCFIDQLPRGLRKSLYFKDDDLRLSFLTGNYVTLTNLTDAELDRLISYRFSPMNISVHTTDPQLRVRMLHNKNAGDILAKLEKIAKAGIRLNCQIVLCPGVNDGPDLDRTLKDLFGLGEALQSVALVPVGLTRFRTENGLPELLPYDAQSAREIVEKTGSLQKECLRLRGKRIAYASDEFYSKAGMPFPPAGEYEDFPQLENGVGMVPLFLRDMEKGIRRRRKRKKRAMDSAEKTAFATERTASSDGAESSPDRREEARRAVLLVTGVDAKPYLDRFAPDLAELYDRPFYVKAVANRFFGETVTVAGLVTGGDIIEELRRDSRMRDCVERVIMPECMLRAGEQVFLDDLRVSDVEQATGMKISVSAADGEGFLRMMDRFYPANGEEAAFYKRKKQAIRSIKEP